MLRELIGVLNFTSDTPENSWGINDAIAGKVKNKSRILTN